MTAHIAIFSCPVPALINPTLSVVACLVRRGYRVTYVTSERFATEVALLGADVLRCPRIDAPFDQDDSEVMPIEHQYVRDVVNLASRTFAQVWPFFERNRPDVLIYDLVAFAGVLVADKSGIPAIRMSNQFAYTEEALDSEEIPREWKQNQLDLNTRVNQFFSSHASRKRDVFLNGTDPTFYFYMRELQLGKEFHEHEDFYAARCTAERPNVAWWRRPTPRNKPSVLVASSTTYTQNPRYYNECLHKLSQSGWEAFLAGQGRVAGFGSLPENCHPIQVPLAAVMPHVDLIICGAGMATTMEALYHGVPMLMLTSGHAELQAYAQKFERCGLGVHLNHVDGVPDNVVSCAVRMLGDQALRSDVKRMQGVLRRSAGAEEFVNHLEEIASRRCY